MPEFVLNRTHALRSTLGHIINFTKGQPTYVPPELVKEALEIGADPVETMDKTDALLGVQEGDEQPVLSAEARRAAITEAFAKLEHENNRSDFTAAGAPKPAAIKRMTGFDVENRERDEAWRAYKEAKVLAAD